MDVRFGPAGLGPVKTAEKVLEQYHAKGFRACEIAFTYSAYIKDDEDAIRIGKKAKELDIELSIHGSYFINLNSDEAEKRKSSKERLLECCRVGELLGAKVVVFHPAFYGKNKERAYENVKKGILEVQEEIRKNGWKIKLAPETMGKVNVFGSVEEISKLVEETGCSYCIDFAHILARDKKVDYAKIEKLFPGDDWHVHFSGIIYGEKGEKKHRETRREEWEELLKNLPSGKRIRIVNESPSMVEDSEEGLGIWKDLKG